ncbi:Hpt domain-containing protein, partial [Teichococcus aerofrigidensis]
GGGGGAGAPPPPPAAAPPSAAVLDLEAAEALASDLGAAAPAVLQEFLDELERGAELLDGLGARPEAEESRLAAHRLLGVARTIGAQALAQCLETLQTEARHGTPSPTAADAARRALAEALPLLRGWITRQATEARAASD